MPEIKELVKNLAGKHGRTRESLIPILQGIIHEERYISDEAMTEIARELDISAAGLWYRNFLLIPRYTASWQVCNQGL